MLISETHFTLKTYWKIPDYSLYHTMHPTGKGHGGSAVLIKTKIKHHQSMSYCKDYLQAANVVVSDWISSFTVSAVYCPPKHSIKEAQFNEFFVTLGPRFIAGGDYNAKHTFWGSRHILTRGRELFKSIQAKSMDVISTGQPTYWPTDRDKTPDVIDFCVIKGITRNNISCQSCLELSSDHSPVLLELNTRVKQKTRKCTLHNKNTDWPLFRALVCEALSKPIRLKSESDVVEAVEFFNSSVQDAAWKATPTYKIPTIDKHVASHVLDKINQKRKIRQQWQLTRCPEIKRRLNHAIRELKQTLAQDRNNDFQSYLTGLDANASSNYTLWKATKKLKRPTTISPPLRTLDGSWARTDQEKAETFSQHLKNVFKPHPYEGTLDHEREVLEFLDAPNTKNECPAKFTKKEVLNIIKKGKLKKSPGYDLITNRLLQELPDPGLTLLTSIYNAMTRLTFFPPQWKVGQIIMILKPGKEPDDPKSYRPISLLPIPSKIYETLLLTRILPVIEAKHIIPDHQFGFRCKHSTIDQVHRLVDKIMESLEAKAYCASAFLDISQAFDRVWHEGLLYKTKKAMPGYLYQIVKSFVEKRHFLTQCGDAITGLCPIQAGVPQGSVMGPILYLLFTSDLPTSKLITTGTFADDTAILASHNDPEMASAILQDGLDSISSWLKKWRIKANETKSINVTFSLRRGPCPPVKLNNMEIPQADHVRYLGLHLDKRLTWQKHIFTKRKQLGMEMRKLYWLLGQKSQLSLENKLLIYKVILKPIWSYGIQLWGTASHSNIEILQRFQNKTLRIITNAPWFVPNEQLHHDLRIPTVIQEITLHAKNHEERLKNHPNDLAKTLLKDDEPTKRRLKRRMPHDLLKI